MKNLRVKIEKILCAVLLLSALVTMAACSQQVLPSSTHDPRIIEENKVLDLVTAAGVTIAPTVTLLYTLAPPPASATGGVQTYANDITTSGGLFYTAFNTVGVPQAGAADIIYPGLLGLTPATIQSTTTFTDFDVNRAFVYNNQLWMVGALQDVGAYYRKAPITSGAIGTVDLQGSLSSYAATGLTSSGTSLFATTGDTGGLTVLNSTTGAVTSTTTINDARSVTTLANGDIVVLTGGSCGAGSTAGVLCNTANATKTPPTLTRYTSAGVQVWSKTLTGATIGQSKSNVVAGSTYLVASLGDGGFSVICQADGAIMATQTAVTVSGLDPTLSVTNSVAVAPGMVLAANGQAGVYMYQVQPSSTGPASSCAKIQLTGMGSVNFGDNSSANNITSESFSVTAGILGTQIYAGRFYVASGVKGFRVVSINFTILLANPLTLL